MTQYTQEERVRVFWSRVDMSGGPDACWPWLAYRNSSGYGRTRWQGKIRPAHRVAYELTYGKPPNNLAVLHKCEGGGNACCVNPRHLALGTSLDNAADAKAAGRLADIHGERNPHCKLSDEQVNQIRSLYRTGVRTRELSQQFSVHISYVRRLIEGVYRAT